LHGNDVGVGLAGMTEEERGFAMALSSKVYSCLGAPRNAAAFNDGSDPGALRYLY
jgi:hypothetical protein